MLFDVALNDHPAEQPRTSTRRGPAVSLRQTLQTIRIKYDWRVLHSRGGYRRRREVSRSLATCTLARVVCCPAVANLSLPAITQKDRNLIIIYIGGE